MKIGDLIIRRRHVPWGRKLVGFGIVVDYNVNTSPPDVDWALIFWGNDTMTWEDVKCSMEDGTFEVISEST